MWSEMDRRGFLTALLMVPAAAAGVMLYPEGMWRSAGLMHLDLTIPAKPLVPESVLRGAASGWTEPVLSPEMLDEAFDTFWFGGFRADAALMDEIRQAQAEIDRMAAIPKEVLELTPDASKRILNSEGER